MKILGFTDISFQQTSGNEEGRFYCTFTLLLYLSRNRVLEIATREVKFSLLIIYDTFLFSDSSSYLDIVDGKTFRQSIRKGHHIFKMV